MQNQQLGGRVYSRHARPLVHRVQHIAGIIQAQEGSSMVAASRLGGIVRFPYGGHTLRFSDGPYE